MTQECESLSRYWYSYKYPIFNTAFSAIQHLFKTAFSCQFTGNCSPVNFACFKGQKICDNNPPDCEVSIKGIPGQSKGDPNNKPSPGDFKLPSANPAPQRPNEPKGGSCCSGGSANVISGLMSYTYPIVSFPTKGYPLTFNLHYSTLSDNQEKTGFRWSDSPSRRAVQTTEDNTLWTDVHTENGIHYRYYYDNATEEYVLDDFIDPVTNIGTGSDRMRIKMANTTFEDEPVLEETLPIGKRYQYCPKTGRLLRILDIQGNVVNYNYNIYGQCISIDDNGGDYKREIKLQYDSMRRLNIITDPFGAKTTVYYSNRSLPEKIVGPEGCITQFEYDNNCRMTKKILPNGGEYTYTYNQEGQQTSVTNPMGETTTYTYERNLVAGSGFLATTTITDPDGKQSKYHMNRAALITEETDGENNRTNYEYDRWNLTRITEGTVSSGNEYIRGSIHSFIYDNEDRVKTYIDPNGRTVSFSRNENGDITSVREQAVSYYPGGNFEGVFGSDGFLLCAYQIDGDDYSDLINLPDYIEEIQFDEDLIVRVNDTTLPVGEDKACLYYSQAADPKRRFARWYISSEEETPDSFDMTVKMAENVTEDRQFNIAIYSHGLHTEDDEGKPTVSNWFCRKLTFTVTDVNGTQDYTVENTFSGTWVSFTVTGKYGSDISINVSFDPDDTWDISLSAIAFDPPGESKISYQYDEYRNLTGITDAQGNQAQYTYDSNGLLLSASDFEGNLTSYQYDGYGNFTKVTYPTGAGSETDYILLEYDSIAHADVTCITDSKGAKTRIQYDVKRRVKTVEYPGGATISYSYDNTDNVTKITDGEGKNTTLIQYDLLSRPVKKTFSTGAQVLYQYKNTGTLQTVTDPRGNQTSLEYYNNGWLKKIIFADGNTLQYQYLESGDLTQVTLPDSNTIQYEYHLDHSLKKITLPDSTTREAAYNLFGRISQLTDGRENSAYFEYDTLQQLQRTIAPLLDADKVLSYEYNKNGQVTKVTDPKGNSSAYSYDKAGLLSRIDYADESFETFAYDGRGNLTAHTDGRGLTTAYQYNQDNRLISVDLPNNEGSIRISYDSFGRALQRDDQDGSRTQYAYDSKGRLCLVHKMDQYCRTISRNSYTYDFTSSVTGFSDDAGTLYGTGSKYAQSNRIGVNAEKYDHRFKYGQIKFGGSVKDLYGQTRYGAVEPVTPGETDIQGRIKYGEKRFSSFEYDKLGRLDEYTDYFGNSFTTGYDRLGRAAFTAYPNGVVTRRTFDSAGRLSGLSHSRRNSSGVETVVKSFAYIYDGNGSITSIIEEDGKYNEYVYDQWDRLIDEQRKTSVGAVIYRSQFAYDDAGNITEIIRTTSAGVATTAFTYDDCNRITQVSHPDSTTEVFAYDGAGNLISRTRSNGETAVYHWNSAGFLTQVVLPDGSPVKYQYDGANRLTGREYAGRADRFIQSGWSITKEKDQSRRATYHTGYSSISGGGDVAMFHHFNHRGDVVLITDGGGEIVKSFYYGAYGDVIGEEAKVMRTGLRSDSSMPEVFAGAYGIRRDTTTGLDYMRFRWYANDLSSFISADRIRGTNRYAYAKGNPVKYVDPMGLKEQGFPNVYNSPYYEQGQEGPYQPASAFHHPDYGHSVAMPNLTNDWANNPWVQAADLPGPYGAPVWNQYLWGSSWNDPIQGLNEQGIAHGFGISFGPFGVQNVYHNYKWKLFFFPIREHTICKGSSLTFSQSTIFNYTEKDYTEHFYGTGGTIPINSTISLGAEYTVGHNSSPSSYSLLLSLNKTPNLYSSYQYFWTVESFIQDVQNSYNNIVFSNFGNFIYNSINNIYYQSGGW